MTESTALIGPHAPGVMEQAVEDDLIVFNPKTESYYTLNRTAREVWELADGTRSAPEIAEHLAQRYGAEFSAITVDVAAIIANLEAADLI